MKKLLFILLLSLASSAMYAQITGSNGPYANGDSFGYNIDDIPGAVSYEWSVQGATGAIIWPAWDTAVDLTFENSGICDLTCTVTLDDGSVEVYTLTLYVRKG
jgi:hypothetical protein